MTLAQKTGVEAGLAYPALHASLVTSAGELKFCEVCGGMFLLPHGYKYCHRQGCQSYSFPRSNYFDATFRSNISRDGLAASNGHLDLIRTSADSQSRERFATSVLRYRDTLEVFSGSESLALVEEEEDVPVRLPKHGSLKRATRSSSPGGQPSLQSERAQGIRRVVGKKLQTICSRKHPFATRALAEKHAKKLRMKGAPATAYLCPVRLAGKRHWHCGGVRDGAKSLKR